MNTRIAIISQKGGSGKTTLAVHMAIVAQQDHQRVKVWDADPQGSAVTFAKARGDKTGLVEPANATRLASVIGKHKGVSIIDTAPHSAPDAAIVARLADLILIPCRPWAFDLAAMRATTDLTRASGAKTVFVLNACPTKAPEVVQIRRLLGSYGIPTAITEITDRRAYARAVAMGQSVTEFEPRGKAAEEMRSLWREVKRWLS